MGRSKKYFIQISKVRIYPIVFFIMRYFEWIRAHMKDVFKLYHILSNFHTSGDGSQWQ